MQVRIRSLSLGRGGCVVTNTQHRAFDQLAIFTISMFDVFVNTQKKKKKTFRDYNRSKYWSLFIVLNSTVLSREHQTRSHGLPVKSSPSSSFQMSPYLRLFLTLHWPEQKRHVQAVLVTVPRSAQYVNCACLHPSMWVLCGPWLAPDCACLLLSAEQLRRQMDCWIRKSISVV